MVVVAHWTEFPARGFVCSTCSSSIAAVLVLYQFLGLWGSLAVFGVVVAFLLVLRAYGEKLMDSFIHREVRALGKVMHGAAVTIHSVSPAPEPDLVRLADRRR